MNEKQRQQLAAETDAVEAAVQRAVAEALLAHKRAGHSVVSWENGQVVLVPPEDIPVDDDPV